MRDMRNGMAPGLLLPSRPGVHTFRMAHTAETTLRIVRLTDLMREWKYDSKARKALALEWEVTEDRVTDLACEARDIVLAEFSADQVKLDAGQVLRKIMLSASAGANPQEVRNAIEAAKTLASLVGANAPAKNETTFRSVGLDDVDSLRKAAEANECPPQPKPNASSEPRS